nr:AAA family ATPase [Saprospiraceae bacterium]
MTEAQPIQITGEFHEAMDLIENSGNAPVFVTGSAGTGKSTLLKLYRDSTADNVVCLAPTGVAALNIVGQTIHSFFAFPPRLLQPGEFKIWKNKRLIKKLDTIIIDEISMVRADLMDGIDYYLRAVRKSEVPFGGVKMVFFGDLFQLPPIVRGAVESDYFNTEFETPYFFSAHVFQEVGLKVCELREVFRQTDKELVKLLNRIRTHTFDREDLEVINQCVDPTFVLPDLCITLAGRNDVVSAINRQKLAEIEAEPKLYPAKVKGKFPPNSFPTDQVLSLKEGAQVIFLRNDPEFKFVNGTLGKVMEVGKDHVLVSVSDENGKTDLIEVEPFKWDMIEYKFDATSKAVKSKSIGEFVQYPLKLAWALTIHKSQGKTFDRVYIDLSKGGAFESGQAYVALSRCRTKEGIVLKRPILPGDIKIDHRISEFFKYGV